MGQVISNLKARFGVDTSDLKKGLKDGEKAVDDFKDAAGNSIDKLADLFGVNMGAVNSALETTQRSLNFLGQSFGAAAKGGKVLSVALQVLKVAMISTGIGALVVALGSLVAYFTKSGKGADQLAVALAQIKSVVNNVIERLAILGEGLFLIVTGKFREGWDRMKESIKGVGEEMKADWKAAGDLARREDELYDKETALITALEERRRKVAELRLQAKEEKEDRAKAMALLEQAMALEKSITADQVSLEQERLAIMKEKLEIQSKDPTDEQLREIAEQEAKVNSLRAEGADAIRALQREYGTLKTAVEQAAEAERKLAEEREKSWQAMVKQAKPETPELIDVKSLTGQLAEVKGAAVSTLTSLDKQLNQAIEGSLETLASGFGEMLGNLAIGEAGFQDFGKLVSSAMADMAITVGKIAIATGIASAGIKKALSPPLNPAAAIAAGIALVALGSIVKGALANAASGGGSAGSMSAAVSGGGNLSFDTRLPSKQEQVIRVEHSGKLTAEGKELVYVFDQENSRRKSST